MPKGNLVNEYDLLIKALILQPGSAVILMSSIITLFIYLFRIRLILIERKLGISHNGKPLEQMVTRADLNEFGQALIKELGNRFVNKDVCELQHKQR